MIAVAVVARQKKTQKKKPKAQDTISMTVATAACDFFTIVTPMEMVSLTVGNSQLNAQITF